MDNQMNRRGFLKLVPKMAGVSAVALVAPAGLDKLEIVSTEPSPVKALPPEDFLMVANQIVDTVNGRMKSMSEAEMQERASQSLVEYLKRYA